MADNIDKLEDENLNEQSDTLQELDYLNSIPDLIASIHEVMELEDSAFSEDIEW
ncbi:MAG: hypothetical protein ABXS93_00025 [Sulfurimonas sp.]